MTPARRRGWAEPGDDARARERADRLAAARPLAFGRGDRAGFLEPRGPLEVGPRIAHGLVTTVYRARLDGRDAALKVFRPRSVRRHADRHELDIAEFEYRRNHAFHVVPDLTRYIAEPLGFVTLPTVSAVVQELLAGESYHAATLRRGAPPAGVFEHIERLVERAHAAGLYDLDLHALNVLVVEDGGEQIPRLFDFNRIPFHERPRNPIEALGLALGLIDRGSRDRRKLRQLHDFDRLDDRLAGSASP